MKYDANIGITSHLPQDMAIYLILTALEENGWYFLNDGHCFYLPPNDNGMFNWTSSEELERDQLLSLFTAKQENREMIGVQLTKGPWSVSIHFWPDLLYVSIAIWPSLRKKIADTNTTDFSWYLEELLKPLLELNFNYDELKCEEGEF